MGPVGLYLVAAANNPQGQQQLTGVVEVAPHSPQSWSAAVVDAWLLLDGAGTM